MTKSFIFMKLWLFIINIYIFVFNFLITFLWKFCLNFLFYVSGLVKYDPKTASTYLPLSQELKAKACLKIQNNNEKCFLSSILALSHPVQYRNHLTRVSKYQEYEHDLNMSGIQYPVDIKGIGRFGYKNNISVKTSMGTKIKNLPAAQDITWIYYTSLLKNLITYWRKTWADWYQVNIIITNKKHISANIICMVVPVKKYLKAIWKDASYTVHKESSFKLVIRRDVKKLSLQKQYTNCVYLLSSMRISKACYVNKTRVNHRHQNPSLTNTNITLYAGAALLLISNGSQTRK